MSLTAELIDLIDARPVSEADLQAASLFVLDTVAAAHAGRSTEPGRRLLDWGSRVGRDAGRRAFLAGALSHITETDDLHRGSVTHPGCVVVPVALALGERDGHSGRDILTAVLKGYEAMCRIGRTVGPAHYRIWHNTATCGPFGAAMAAACLLKLDREQTIAALGNAGTQSSGVWEFMETGAMSKHLHAGRAAEAGLTAAELAVTGFTGPPAILEGARGLYAAMCPDPAPGALLADPEAPWELHQTSIKPWPSCRHTHPVIDAALQLHGQLDGEPVDKVEIETYQAALDVCDNPMPDSEYAAKFSLYHCAAIALLDGQVGLASFTPEARERTNDLRRRIRVRAANPYVSAYPVAWGARVKIRMPAGRELSAVRSDCLGDPELPLDAAGLRTKAMDLLAFAGLLETEACAVCEEVDALKTDEGTADSLIGRLLA